MDPNPIKHLGSLMKEVRLRIEPILAMGGFDTSGAQVRVANVHRRCVDYLHDSGILAVTYEQHDATLSAEWLDTDGASSLVARTPMNQPRSTAEAMHRIDAFAAEVRRFADSLLTDDPTPAR